MTTDCEIIPNGIDAAGFRSSSSVSDEQLGVPPGVSVILFLGRLHPFKGVERLLSAFIRVANEFPNAMLVLAGPDEFGMSERLKARSREAGLSNRVILTGMVTGERKLDWLARANLFCLPSDGEGFSIAVLEAMASATPVLLSPGCHFPEASTHGAGVIVSNHIGSIAEAMGSLLRDCRENLIVTGDRARVLVETDYQWEHVVDRLLDVYGRSIGRARSS